MRAWRKTFGKHVQWAWFLEFQRRGCPHYHFFVEMDFLEENGFLQDTEITKRAKSNHSVTIIRGDFERVIVELWMSAIDDDSAATKRFSYGGIIERLFSGDGAARYMACYAAKEHQKKAPACYDKIGRYWAINPEFRAKPDGYAVAKHWPFPFRYKYIFDSRMLDELICEARDNVKFPLTDAERGIEPRRTDIIEVHRGRETFVSYSHPELELNTVIQMKGGENKC